MVQKGLKVLRGGSAEKVKRSQNCRQEAKNAVETDRNENINSTAASKSSWKQPRGRDRGEENRAAQQPQPHSSMTQLERCFQSLYCPQ